MFSLHLPIKQIMYFKNSLCFFRPQYSIQSGPKQENHQLTVSNKRNSEMLIKQTSMSWKKTGQRK
jgi:hypothetical protein